VEVLELVMIMEIKNINTGNLSTDGGNVHIGDINNFVIKVLSNPDYQKTKNLKAIRQTKKVLDKITSNIAGITLKRDLSNISIQDLLIDNQFIFINGVAGSGKSVYAKQLLESLNDTCIISFVADQFLESSLITTLNKVNIDESIEDVFEEFAEFPKKLIYIDSFEKLLEGQAEAFQELIFELKKNPNIKIIVSCRDYAIETLKFKFSIDKCKNINVPVLTDDEIKYFVENIPTLQQIVSNNNLTEILRVPKYLSLAERLIQKSTNDLSKISEITFKKELWEHIIQNKTVTIDSINTRREIAFINLTVKRAKELSILTNASDIDQLAIQQLSYDGILFGENGLYAPSHDIFEDWGLIKNFDKYKIENSNIIEFYRNVGNEPAIRRGYRLWIEKEIEESSNSIYNFILETISKNEIDDYWKEEVLTAVIKSQYCKKYFTENEVKLLENNFTLLKRFIHLLKICGKDSQQVPNNKGWDIVIEFLHEKLDELKDLYSLILKLIFEWENILYFGIIENQDTPKYVGKIVFKILNDFDEDSSWMNYGESNSLTEKGIKLLYQLSEYIPEEIKIILDDILNDSLDSEKLKREKIKFALSHFYSGSLPKNFPDELILLANKNWRKKVGKNKENDFYDSSYGVEQHFGLTKKHDFSYFPHSAYQTFFYKLIKFHPWKALAFIIDFTNYVSEQYIESTFLKDDGFGRKSDEIIELDLLYDSQIFKIKGSDYLWSINRGGQTTVPYLLQSIVVALERYLYEIGSIESEQIDTFLQTFYDKIYKKSNSVILLSVLSSITMAYPEKVGNKLLPFLSDKYFFIWDRHRQMNEYNSGALLNMPNSSAEGDLCDKERKDALGWQHRTKYSLGFQSFIFEYQVRYVDLRDEIFQMLDILKSKIKEDDIYGKKILVEIDLRNQKVEKIENEEGKVMLQISPNYSIDRDLENVMIKNQEKSIISNKDSSYSLWVTNIYQKKSEENKTYKFWKECFNYLTDVNNSYSDPIMAFPVGTFAVLGLESFDSELNDIEFKYCIDIIIDISNRIFQKQLKEYDFENPDFSISIYDYDSIFSILPQLLKFKEKITIEQKKTIRGLIYTFLRDLNVQKEHHLKLFYKSFKGFLWKIDYQFAHNCFTSLILYAEFNKKYPQHKQYSNNQIKTIQLEQKVILDFVENNREEFIFSNISYSNYSQWDLHKALFIFPTNELFYFSNDFVQIIFKAQIESYTLDLDRYSSTNYYEIGNTIKDVINEFLLENEFTENSKHLFNQIIDVNLNLFYKNRKIYDIKKYVESLIEFFYYKVDNNSENELIKTNFWIYWNELYLKIKDNNNFSQEFLFYSSYWKSDVKEWKVLKGKSEKYLIDIENLSYVNIKALMQLLSNLGFDYLMPNGLKILVKHLKADSINFDYYYGEKLIMNCFKQKIKEIKEDRILLEDFLWLLDLMINLGSSKAYLIRENIILYKH
jgi:hypothetical protein